MNELSWLNWFLDGLMAKLMDVLEELYSLGNFFQQLKTTLFGRAGVWSASN